MKMYRARRLKGVSGCLLLFLLAGFSGAAVPIPTVGVYDETTTQSNNVDFNAVFSSGTGGATVVNTTTASTGDGGIYSTIGAFNGGFGAAFPADAGGGWDFVIQTTGYLPG